MQRLVVDATKEIYRSLPLQSVKVVHLCDPASKSGNLDSLLPGMAGLVAMAQGNRDD